MSWFRKFDQVLDRTFLPPPREDEASSQHTTNTTNTTTTTTHYPYSETESDGERSVLFHPDQEQEEVEVVEVEEEIVVNPPTSTTFQNNQDAPPIQSDAITLLLPSQNTDTTTTTTTTATDHLPETKRSDKQFLNEPNLQSKDDNTESQESDGDDDDDDDDEEESFDDGDDDDDNDDDDETDSDFDSDEDDPLMTQQQHISWDIKDDNNLNPNLNCHGIVHVKIRLVKYLPCARESSVHAILALKPWRGHVKTKKVLTLTQYDKRKHKQKRKHPTKYQSKIKYKDEKSCQFLHAYNNEDTPIPTLTIDFILTTLQIMETNIASFSISALPLMSTPGVWHRQWFLSDTKHNNNNTSTKSSDNHSKSTSGMDSNLNAMNPPPTTTPTSASASTSTSTCPRILLELCFQPSHSNHNINNNNNNNNNDSWDLDYTFPAETSPETISNEEVVTDTPPHLHGIAPPPLPPPPPPLQTPSPQHFSHKTFSDVVSSVPSSHNEIHQTDAPMDTQSIATSHSHNTISAVTTTTTTNNMSIIYPPQLQPQFSKTHLFRLQSFWSPAYCAVCSSLITTKLWGKQGYRCEYKDCHLDVCGECQLQSNLRYPCGSEKTQHFVASRFRSRLKNVDVMEIMAPTTTNTPATTPTTTISNVNVVAKEEDLDHSNNFNGSVMAEEDKGGSVSSAQRSLDTKPSQLPPLPSSTTSTTSSLLPPFTKKLMDTPSHYNMQDTKGSLKTPPAGIGTLHIQVSKACLYDRSFPPETSISELTSDQHSKSLRSSDYYVRLWIHPKSSSSSSSNHQESLRTPTVYQTSKPIFEQELPPIPILHYGMEFRVDVMDAMTDQIVGMALLSTQGILQRQRDDWALQEFQNMDPKILLDPRESIIGIACEDEHHPNQDIVSELRTGAKTGFGLDFYNHSDGISGWIRMAIRLEEHKDVLFSLEHPRPIPSRPPEDFHVELIQLYIARIGTMIQDLKACVEYIQYWVSWDDPAVTGLAMIVFVFTCLRFHAEYAAHLPVLFLWIGMLRLAHQRRMGQYKMRWVEKERDDRIDAEKKLAISYKVHRPCAKVKAMVTEGRNLWSRELGLPGSLYVSVSYDPLRIIDEKTKGSIIDLDATSSRPHELGSTWVSVISTNPIWDKINESDESKRLKQLLSQSNILRESTQIFKWDEELTFTFPILQTLNPETAGKDSFKDNHNHHKKLLIPWEDSPGALVFQVRFDQLFNKLLVFNDILGEVTIPLSEVIRSSNKTGRHFQLKGWFKVQEVGANTLVPLHHDFQHISEVDNKEVHPEHNHDSPTKKASSEEVPAIFLQVEFTLPDDRSRFSDLEKESSIVVAEEMIRSNTAIQNATSGMIGSSINTINTVRGLGGNLQGIQNQLGDILDVVESIRNAFNWTSPQQTMVVFMLVFALWFVLFLIPGRVLILCGGLGVFIGNLITKFSLTKKEKNNQSNNNPGAIPILLKNFFQSLPTDEDLRRVYFWESRRVGEEERKKQAEKKRTSRLKILWNAHWFGELQIKTTDNNMKNISSDPKVRVWVWEPIFAVIQGHRFVWWRSEKHFDEGDTPMGHIIFAGHSGLAGLSPLELRELQPHEILQVVNIFGRGNSGEQQKISLLLPHTDAKTIVENAVFHATNDTKRD